VYLQWLFSNRKGWPRRRKRSSLGPLRPAHPYHAGGLQSRSVYPRIGHFCQLCNTPFHPQFPCWPQETKVPCTSMVSLSRPGNPGDLSPLLVQGYPLVFMIIKTIIVIVTKFTILLVTGPGG